MTTEVNTDNGTEEVPTATEYIPADQVAGPNRTGKPMVRGLQLVRDEKGVEIAYHEAYDDDITNHTFVCDECGRDEANESDIAFHLRTHHRD